MPLPSSKFFSAHIRGLAPPPSWLDEMEMACCAVCGTAFEVNLEAGVFSQTLAMRDGEPANLILCDLCAEQARDAILLVPCPDPNPETVKAYMIRAIVMRGGNNVEFQQP